MQVRDSYNRFMSETGLRELPGDVKANISSFLFKYYVAEELPRESMEWRDELPPNHFLKDAEIKVYDLPVKILLPKDMEGTVGLVHFVCDTLRGGMNVVTKTAYPSVLSLPTPDGIAEDVVVDPGTRESVITVIRKDDLNRPFWHGVNACTTNPSYRSIPRDAIMWNNMIQRTREPNLRRVPTIMKAVSGGKRSKRNKNRKRRSHKRRTRQTRQTK
jgi:hypothetical protein